MDELFSRELDPEEAKADAAIGQAITNGDVHQRFSLEVSFFEPNVNDSDEARNNRYDRQTRAILEAADEIKRIIQANIKVRALLTEHNIVTTVGISK